MQAESAELMAALAAEIAQQEQLLEAAQAELDRCQAAADTVGTESSICNARRQASVQLCSQHHVLTWLGHVWVFAAGCWKNPAVLKFARLGWVGAGEMLEVLTVSTPPAAGPDAIQISYSVLCDRLLPSVQDRMT